MIIRVFDDKLSLGEAAAEQAAIAIRNAIDRAGKARVIAASAASQFQFLDALTRRPEIDWKRVELFHLDEYIGLPIDSPGQFLSVSAGASDQQNRNHELPFSKWRGDSV